MQRLILGIGNVLGGDDGAGNFVVQVINRRLKSTDNQDRGNKIIAMDAGTAPESFTSIVRRYHPECVVLVDAADMGLPPGSVRLVPPERVQTLSYSSHIMPLTELISYIHGFCGRVCLVGIQPGNTEQGQGLSNVVRRSGEAVAGLLLTGSIEDIQPLD